jgi:ribosome-associated toxin RatA of RatAB toxin-antitoxin module
MVTRALRMKCLAAAIIAAAIFIVSLGASTGTDVRVREEKGTYYVTAVFEVAQTPAVAHAVLTDYEQVPKFMPDVRVSVVRERTAERVLLEQEAVAKLMFFSKRVHLLLEVQETPGTIRFKDVSHKSFELYDGGWTLTVQGDRTVIGYRLSAKPSFSVPEFVLTRLLKRDSIRMIEGLQAEMARRQ